MKKKMLIIVEIIALMFYIPTVSAATIEVSNDADLINAFKNAENNDIIKLTNDIVHDDTFLQVDNGRTITFDLNGRTLKINDENSSNRSIRVYNGNLTIKNGIITYKTHNAINVKGSENLKEGFSSKLIVEKDVTLEGLYGIAVFVESKNGAYGVTVDFAGKIEATEGGITINGKVNQKDGAPVINVLDGAVINSKLSGLYAAGSGTWNIGNVNITGDGSAFGIKSGKININGGTFISNGKSQIPTEGYSNGINASGSTIQLESNNQYYGNVELIIKDGTFKSTNAFSIYEYLDKNTNNTNINKIEILGGKFESANGMNNFLLSEELAYKGIISVSGGTFNANPVNFLKPAHKVVLENDKYVVSPINVAEGKFKISGTITNGNNAKVQLVQGSNVLYTVNANENGEYEFTKVEKGKYNIIFVSGNYSTTKLIEVTDKDIEVNAEIKTNSTTITVGVNTPNVLVEGLDNIDGNIELIANLEEKDANSTAQNKILVETKNKESLFLNFEIRKGNELIDSTSNVLHLIISLDTLNKENLELYRYHINQVDKFTKLDKMPTEYKDKTFYIDEENKELHIFTDKFSTYGITYNTKTTDNPKTFDGTFGYALLTLISVLAISSITIYRKKVSVR